MRDAVVRNLTRDINAKTGDKFVRRGHWPGKTKWVRMRGDMFSYEVAEKKIDTSKLDTDWDYDTVVVHHSGNGGAKHPIDIQKIHLKKYDAVGYHYMIHPAGTIYEGRPIMFKGAHVRMKNTGKIGILMMGDYDQQWWDFDDSLSRTHLDRLLGLVGVLKKYFPITTLGGHKEFLKGYTCPGNLLMGKMASLRTSTGLGSP